ncbi:MAG: hypothetical protein ACI9V1_001639 [Spirosomataceae bacterium]|jgi:hypothetical protein
MLNMKNVLLSVLVLFTSFSAANSQEFAKVDKSSLDIAYYPTRAAFKTFAKTDEEKVSLTPKIRVVYSRPMASGRTIFGELVPFDKPWRIGANESTEIQFLTPVKIGDNVVPAGRYTLYAIPTKDSWTVKINLDVDGWGAYAYRPEMDVASITVPTSSVDDAIDAFSVALYEAPSGMVHLKMSWDKTVVEVPIMLL